MQVCMYKLTCAVQQSLELQQQGTLVHLSLHTKCIAMVTIQPSALPEYVNSLVGDGMRNSQKFAWIILHESYTTAGPRPPILHSPSYSLLPSYDRSIQP